MDNEKLEKLVRSVLRELLQEGAGNIPEASARVEVPLIGGRALLLYTGAQMSFHQSLAGLEQLKKEGYRFDIFFSAGAQEVLETEEILRRLNPERVRSDETCSPEGITGDYDLILVPALSIATASKVANCIPDSPAARLLFHALATGKKTILIKDGCCPEFSGWEAGGFCMARAMKEKLRDNLKRLASYGAVVISAEQLPQVFRKITAAVRQKEPAGQMDHPAGTSERLHVIGKDEVELVPRGGILTVSRHSTLTALAADRAREREVTIQWE